MTAIILAAGLGSRYGGLKQLDPVGHHGEFIIDYSVYDCIRAGFDRIVFIIKEENLEIFEDTIGKRIKGDVKIEYAFQNSSDLPDGFSCPADRKKPWGTAHALRACRNIVDDKFIIFNADDFYGRETFENMAKSLEDVDSKTFSMPGYILENTLSENGHVTRGVCTTDGGMLTGIKETKQIMRVDGEVRANVEGDSKPLDARSPVSMNFWGFTPDVFDYVEDGFVGFLKNPDSDLLTGEYCIPDFIGEGIADDKFACRVIETPAKWMGVTYRSDKPAFLAFLDSKIACGDYPENLWGI